jgi:hypothetical protein
MSCESNAFASAVAVCGNRSLLIHTTRSRRATINVGGSKRIYSITTTYVAAIASTGNTSAAIRQTSRRMSRTALRQFRLQMTRVFEMRDERRSHLHELRLQFFVLRARNERLVERVEHAF